MDGLFLCSYTKTLPMNGDVSDFSTKGLKLLEYEATSDDVENRVAPLQNRLYLKHILCLAKKSKEQWPAVKAKEYAQPLGLDSLRKLVRFPTPI